MNFLREYQKPHVEHLLKVLRTNRAALDASDTGTGKTPCALALAQALDCVPLILCPKSVIPSWEEWSERVGVPAQIINYEGARGVSRYIKKPLAETWAEIQLQCCAEWKEFEVFAEWARSTKFQETRRLAREDEDEAYSPNNCRWALGPRETESAFGHEVLCARGSRWQWGQAYEMAIFDEVDRCSGATSLQSKMLIAAKRQFRYVHTMSATAADSPLKLKALGYALGLHSLSDYKWWLFKHGVKPGVFGGFQFPANSDDPLVAAEARQAILDLNSTLFPARAARLRKADIPGFPKTIIDARLLDPTDKARRLAGEIAELYQQRRAQQDDAATALEKLIRARQALELLKVPDMKEFAVDYAQSCPVVCFVNYRETAKQLAAALSKALGCEVPILDGDTSAEDRGHIEKDMQGNRLPALVANTAAGGVGIGFHDPFKQTERVSLFSPPDRADLLKQGFGRVNRDGGGFSQQYLLVFRGTEEESIATNVRAKADRIDLLNDGDLTP